MLTISYLEKKSLFMNCMNVLISKNNRLFFSLTISLKLIETKYIHVQAYICIKIYNENH